ncbi:MAG: NTP transferase domain-containing protein [Acidobacteriaceae bacterium]|nr:NTP transferase domain-containing protein [Acidobacteriaceae bacterium]MBV9764084.1 NTP transferase domain-containing protein [Acidobacteriaceae bacterium]
MPSEERTGILIQARIGSSRLKEKALQQIGGKPVLRRLYDRMKLCKRASVVAVATSDTPENQVIEDACRSWDVPVFRGPEVDLLSRYLGAAEFFDFSILVRVTGDNPLTDPEGVDSMISAYLEGSTDVVHNCHRKGYPYGTGSELAHVSALKACNDDLRDEASRELVFSFLRNHPERFRCVELDAPPELSGLEYRFSVDYAEDLDFLREIYARFDGRDDMKLGDVVNFLRANPEVAQLNAHLCHGYSA